MKEKYMQRALELAKLGLGTVSPNPKVGCVIVHDGKIIGEGYHQQYGQAHAEVNAVNSVKDQSLLPEAEMYVTLEPCSHHGKTPPCADLIIKHQLKKVYVCNLDPNPLVAGNGIQRIKDQGIEVETDLLAEQGEEVNKRFFTFMREKRPYIFLKWAQTADGFVARKNYDSKWISSSRSRKMVHKMRAEEDSIMVGTSTAEYDNPTLNVRSWQGKDPVRVFIDRKLRLSKELNLFDGQQATICYTLQNPPKDEKNLTYVKLTEDQFLPSLLSDLFQRGIQSIIIEGGSQLLHLFIENGLWDEAIVFENPKQFFHEGIKAPTLSDAILQSEEILDGDRLKTYRKKKL